jgi:hypothetical protein
MNEQWRLPTRDELNEIYIQLHLKGRGGLVFGYYWTSLEEGVGTAAWYQQFNSGTRCLGYKGDSLRVRLVRSIPEADSNNGLVLSLDGKFFEVAEKDAPMKMTWDEVMRMCKTG